MARRPTLTTSGGMPVADNQNSITAGARGPVLMQDFHLLEKLAHQNRERIPERTVHAKWPRRLWHADGDQGHQQIHEGQSALAGRQEDRSVPALLDRCRRTRRGRRRTRRSRLCAALLHRGRQLGHRRQQHAGVLRARSAEIPGLYSHAKAPPAHQHAFTDRHVGFLVAVAGKSASGDDPDVGSRAAAKLSQRRRLRLAHLLVHQRAE